MSGKDEIDGGVNIDDNDVVLIKTAEVEVIDLEKGNDESGTCSQDDKDSCGNSTIRRNYEEIQENLDKLRDVVEKGNAFMNQNGDNNTSTVGAGCSDIVNEKINMLNEKNREKDQEKNSDSEVGCSYQKSNSETEKSIPMVTVKVEPIKEGYPEIDPSQYRVKIESESEEEDDSSSSSSSSSSESEEEENKEASQKKQRSRQSSTSSQNEKNNKFSKDEIRTKGELFPEELPTIEELRITVDESVSLVHIGDVTSVVGVLAIVQSNQNMPPLNDDTIIFLEGRISCGKIFEVFGPVASPWYSLRFNSPEDVAEKGVTVGTKMYCAPKKEEYTNYVFVEHLKQIKGSDASWEDNNEPPDKFLDFSDDEEEKRAKAKNRNKKQSENDGDQLPGAKQRRKNKKQVPENNTEQQNNMTNQPHHRSNGPRKFAPFGGQMNKFQPRGSYQQAQSFPRQPFGQGGGIAPSSFSRLPVNSNRQFPIQRTGQPNINFAPPACPPNNGHVIPDFTRPPPNFAWDQNNSGQNNASFQSYVPPQHNGRQMNNQTNYFPVNRDCSTFQNYNGYGSNFDSSHQENGMFNSNNINSNGSATYGSSIGSNNSSSNDFGTYNSSFQSQSQNGGPIVDNRFIQNASYNQPRGFQGQGQFGRYNQQQ